MFECVYSFIFVYTLLMQKIVIDARESGTSTGRYIDKLLEHLSALNPNYKVLVLTKQNRVEELKKIAPNFKIIEINVKEFTFAEQIKLLYVLIKIKADLVHFGMVQQPIFYKGAIVTSIQDLTTLHFNNPSKNYFVFKFKQFVYGLVIKKVAKKSKIVITPSRFVKEELIKYTNQPEDRFRVTYYAAEPIKDPVKEINYLKGKKFLLYVGRPMEHKNLKRLVLSFKLLLKDQPNINLVFAGKKDKNYLDLERFVNKQNVPNIYFTNFVSDGELKWLYKNCSAFVFPSLSEGFGFPGLEAMVEGAPVLSSNKTCLPEIYGNGALYFNPLDIQDLKNKLKEVLTDSKLQASLIKNGFNQSEKYSWEKTALETLSIYNKILG